MNLQIGQSPSPTFAEPLELLSDCHRRVEFFLGILARVGEDASETALSPPEREALAAALRYFREAAPRHTADEEDSLFPRLRRSGHPLATAVLAQVELLEADHLAAGADHAEVEACGQTWLGVGQLSTEARARFCAAVARLQARYGPHIALEDGTVFPAAASILSAADLAEVGGEMARRRGLRLRRQTLTH